MKHYWLTLTYLEDENEDVHNSGLKDENTKNDCIVVVRILIMLKQNTKPSTQLCILLILFLWFSCQGTIEFNLNNMPMPAKKSSSCDLKMLPDINMGTSAVKTVSLFEQKRLRGFWPVFDEKDGVRQLTVSTSLYFLFFEILSV